MEDPPKKMISRGRRTREYSTYTHMVDRCCKIKDRQYPFYGGRGIKVCDRWLGPNGFTNFVRDMGMRPEGLTLDRRDNDGDYTPDNCLWATIRQQNGNKRAPGTAWLTNTPSES